MSDTEIAPEILEAVLRTARVKSCTNVFSLAPRGHRVAFYFQQRRAVLLAAALKSRLGRDRLEEARIAILGGGAAGMTVLLALRNEGARNAFLYEAADEVICKGAAASHRLVHPNYNRWPLLGSMDIFTSLPVLNWHAAAADDVIEQMRTQVRLEYPDLINDRVMLGHRAERVTQCSDMLVDPLKVAFKVQGLDQEDTFQIVIIAAGFAKESGEDLGYRDYWTQDANDFDNAVHTRPCSIYGTGDGALIDVARCCAKTPSKAWLIPLGTIADLRPLEALTLLIDNETQDIPPRPPKFMPIERKIQTHEESMRCIAWAASRNDTKIANDYSHAEEIFYRDCVKQIRREQKSLVRFLEEHLKPVADAKLRPAIVGTLDHPFEPTSAPINKLLLAYLIETDRVSYVKKNRRAQLRELKAYQRLPPGQRSQSVVVCRYGAAKNFPVASRGARPPEGITVDIEATRASVCETGVEAQLIDALSSVTGGEYVYFDTMPHPTTQALFGLDREGVTEETRARNGVVLKKFAKHYLSATGVRRVSSQDGKHAKWVVLTRLTPNEITERLREVGGLDGNFFGEPIVVSQELQGTGADY